MRRINRRSKLLRGMACDDPPGLVWLGRTRLNYLKSKNSYSRVVRSIGVKLLPKLGHLAWNHLRTITKTTTIPSPVRTIAGKMTAMR